VIVFIFSQRQYEEKETEATPQGYGETFFGERNGSHGGLHRKASQRRGKNRLIPAAMHT